MHHRNTPISEKSYVAVKFQKSAQHYTEAAYDEIELLNSVKENETVEAWAISLTQYQVCMSLCINKPLL